MHLRLIFTYLVKKVDIQAEKERVCVYVHITRCIHLVQTSYSVALLVTETNFLLALLSLLTLR